MKLLITIIFTSSICFSQNFKMRAREHFEIHEARTASDFDSYSGLTNTINLWWEVPYDYSIGFSFSPILSSIKEKNDDSFLGERIVQQNIGLEYKLFPKIVFKSLYVRAGLGYSKLETNIENNKIFFGNYTYLGLGNEIPFDNYGLAIELAYRYANYNDGLYIKTITPSVGFHFYKNL